MSQRVSKFFKILTFIFTALYIVVCIVLYFTQENFFLYPHPLDKTMKIKGSTEMRFEVDDNIYLYGQLLKGNNKSDHGLVIYLHGNRGNVKRALYQSQCVANHGEDVLVLDYRGFGKSDGEIVSEEQMMNDVQKVYDKLKTQYTESNITVFGYSLGTSMATYLAANNQPKQLILVAPFTSMLDMKNLFAWMFPDFILKYKLDNVVNLKKVQCPTYIVHGNLDELIPVEMSYQLEKMNPELIHLEIATGETHRSTIFSNELKQVCNNILN